MKLKWRASDGKGCIDTPGRSPRNRDTRGYIKGVCAIFITLSSICHFQNEISPLLKLVSICLYFNIQNNPLSSI